ncbi:MAG: hypothetical protein DME77_10580 [Verrucomicrobia bacterium]|nr:MAG: hypothetical protein DME77_10580 [Verrucomicrobiota bacterium]
MTASARRAPCTQGGRLIRFIVRTANEKEEIMRTTSLVIVLVTASALVALGQEGTLQEIKHGAKKTGETIKNGLETAGEKTALRKAKAEATEKRSTDQAPATPSPSDR